MEFKDVQERSKMRQERSAWSGDAESHRAFSCPHDRVGYSGADGME